MKNSMLAVALFAATAVVFAMAGVNTQVFACGNCNKASQAMKLRPRGRLAVLPLIATSPDRRLAALVALLAPFRERWMAYSDQLGVRPRQTRPRFDEARMQTPAVAASLQRAR